MPVLNSIKRKVKSINPGFTVRPELDHIVLEGESADYREIVAAGKAAVSSVYAGVVNNIRLTGHLEQISTPSVRDNSLDGLQCDVLVIGGGVVGCAVLRELARYKLSVVLLEKEYDLATHASSRNDGMVHPGLDLKRTTRKFYYLKRGNAMMKQTALDLGVRYDDSPQYAVYTKKIQKIIYPLFWLRAHNNGIPIKLLKRGDVLKLHPHLNPNIKGGIELRGAGRVCPYNLTIAYAENAVENGAKVYLNTIAEGMKLLGDTIVSVKTNRGEIFPKLVINAAGVFSDDVAEMANDRFFTIHPRKGTNCILDLKTGGYMANSVSRVIDKENRAKHTKGGGVVRTVDGNLLIGPDAHEIPYKEDFSTSPDSIDGVMDNHRRSVPGISKADIITYFSGIRASTYEEEFIVGKGRYCANILHAAGIQSPGLTAAPYIGVELAGMAADMLIKSDDKYNPNFNPIRKRPVKPSELSEEAKDALIRKNPDYGKIICRCEQVSKGEIIDAISGVIPVYALDAIKRRTRAGSGRCQGGFCGPNVLRIVSEYTGMSIDMLTKRGEGSNVVCGKLKKGADSDV